MAWIRERSLTLTLMLLFVLCEVGQILTGWREYNNAQQQHHQVLIGPGSYLVTGHFWEALFENWESEFLQMGAFVILTKSLVQKGSPESRRPNVIEPVDADPRAFRDAPDAPWPVRRGGLWLRAYEHSLGLTFILLFVFSWAGHAFGGLAEYRADEVAHGASPGVLSDYLFSSRFWFESFQNWQSEFLSIAAMVWLSVYLRERGSPESKPVHAPHAENE
jgi:hypothetical protein